MASSINKLETLADVQRSSCRCLVQIANASITAVTTWRTNRNALEKAMKEEEANRIAEEARLAKIDAQRLGCSSSGEAQGPMRPRGLG